LEHKNRRRIKMAEMTLINKIDCPLCYGSETLIIYSNDETYEANCVGCGYKTYFSEGLLNNDNIYEEYKSIVSNNCIDLGISVRWYIKFVFAILASHRGEDFRKYIVVLPEAIKTECPNCGRNISVVHNKFEYIYEANCVCGFKAAFHEDVLFLFIKSGDNDISDSVGKILFAYGILSRL
jgi:Zn ribbon nucleic-acid-binding protein